MKKNVVIIVLLIALGVFIYLWYGLNGDYKDQIDELKAARKTLVIEKADLMILNDSLKNLEPEIITEIRTIEVQLKNQKDETDSIADSVAVYADRKLDSILTNHRHRPRTEN